MPGTRYLVGVLAPRKRPRSGSSTAPAPTPPDEEEETDGDLPDNEDLALGGRDTSQDGTTDQSPAQDKSLIPSSMGLTFSVDKQAKQLEVTASWGQYLKQPSEYLVSEDAGIPAASGSVTLAPGPSPLLSETA